jgi:hypothetical protein
VTSQAWVGTADGSITSGGANLLNYFPTGRGAILAFGLLPCS